MRSNGVRGRLPRVSILTGSEEPVLRGEMAAHTRPASFNPHRLRRAGATRILTYAKRSSCFNPHRLRRAGATLMRGPGRQRIKEFQSSPAPKSRCYAGRIWAGIHSPGVSILTGSEEPVLPVRNSQRRVPLCVSILTGSEEPVLLAAGGVQETVIIKFQSSPAPKSRCYRFEKRRFCISCKFQSSPAPKSRCYNTIVDLCGNPRLFQSSPAPKSRCYNPETKSSCTTKTVSILTGSEEPVLR